MIITEKKLGKAIDAFSNMDVERFTNFIDGLSEKQPGLVGYIVDNVENLSSSEARDEMIFLIAVIWECYSSIKVPIGRITKKEIEKAEKEQIARWKELSEIEDAKKEDAFTRKFITQPFIWTFMNEIVLPNGKMKSNFKKDDDVAITYALVNLVTSLLDQKVKAAKAKKE
jgi:hypothetical protein